MANLFEEATPADVAFEEMLACVDRELKMRAQVYPRWVQQNKLTQEAADRQMLAMRAVRLALLRGMARQMANAACLGDELDKTVGRYMTHFEVDLAVKHPEPQL